MCKAFILVPGHGPVLAAVGGALLILEEGSNGDTSHLPDQPNQETHLQQCSRVSTRQHRTGTNAVTVLRAVGRACLIQPTLSQGNAAALAGQAKNWRPTHCTKASIRSSTVSSLAINEVSPIIAAFSEVKAASWVVSVFQNAALGDQYLAKSGCPNTEQK